MDKNNETDIFYLFQIWLQEEKALSLDAVNRTFQPMRV